MDERADYMMEAFLDEQNTLIRPLVARKLALVHVLDGRVALVERLLEERRKGGGLDLAVVERLEDDLEQLSEEKIGVCQQLMDLVRRPYDTILEVEAALKAAAERDVDQPPVVRQSAARPVSQAPLPASPPEEELWCFCRKPDDGRQMVGCDNPKCEITWWHSDCLAQYIERHQLGSEPTEDSSKKWHCPICIAHEIVSREEGLKKRRRRHTAQ